jgi:NAD(P)-dependent dehydrogenase (short-subunit alcohol dehydrogenase family)
MGPPQSPFQPYAASYSNPTGPGDARPTAKQVIADCKAVGSLTGKAIVVTGAASGIGVATAAALYETGAQLFLTARDVPKLEHVIDGIVSASRSTDVPRPIPVEMHLDSLASVRRAAASIRSQTGTLSIIINNAGIMFVPFEKTEDGFESHLAVNHLAHFLLFQELRPLLAKTTKESGVKSRVICVSSSGHRFSSILFDNLNFENGNYNSTIAYGQSKTANIHMADTLTRLYGNQGIIGLSLHPGVILNTDIYRHMSKEALEDLDSKRDHKQIKSLEQGAATTVWAAVSPHFEDVGNGGRYLSDVGECPPMDASKTGVVGVSGYAPHAYDVESADRLWELSCKAVGISWD